MGERSIAPMGHVRMMAAVQPFISGAISKTVNMPENATVEDVEEIYQQGWKLGLKALAIYRDNCKVGQPLSVEQEGQGRPTAVEAAHAPRSEYRPGAPAAAEEAPDADGVVHRRRRRGLPDHRVLPGRRARRGVHQARQAGLDAGRCDGRVLHRGVGRPAVRHSAGVLRRQVHQPAVRAGRHDRRPGRADRHLGDGLPVPPDRAGLPAVRERGPSWASSPRRSARPRSPPATAAGRGRRWRSCGSGVEPTSGPVGAERSAVTAPAPVGGAAAPPSCWSWCSASPRTRRCASPAARRCARPVPATCARAAAPPAAAAERVRCPAAPSGAAGHRRARTRSWLSAARPPSPGRRTAGRPPSPSPSSRSA